MYLSEEHRLQSLLVAEVMATLIPTFARTAASRMKGKKHIGGGVCLKTCAGKKKWAEEKIVEIDQSIVYVEGQYSDLLSYQVITLSTISCCSALLRRR